MTVLDIIEKKKLVDFGNDLKALILSKHPSIKDFMQACDLKTKSGTPMGPSNLYSCFNGERRINPHVIASWARALDMTPEEMEILYDRPSPHPKSTAAYRDYSRPPARKVSRPTARKVSRPTDYRPVDRDPVDEPGVWTASTIEEPQGVKLTLSGAKATIRIFYKDIPVATALRLVSIISESDLP